MEYLPGLRSLGSEIGAIAHAIAPDAPVCEGHHPDEKPTDDHRVRNAVDWSRIKRLLAECSPERHEFCSPLKVVRPLPGGFRVIDIYEAKLIEPPPNSRFVALSYVWGVSHSSRPALETRLTNLAALEQYIDFSELPRTLRDCITVCRRLGERYLWVDRLCIVQDDARSKPAQIAAMGTIYRSAVFVVLAMAGESAEWGLPGVSCCRAQAAENSDLHLLPGRRTVWWTRGWTYQELVLARRKLYFEDLQVYVECDSVIRQEKVRDGRWKRVLTAHEVLHNQMTLRGVTENNLDLDIQSYEKHAYMYNHRSLSVASDYFDAFAGILTELFESRGGCHFNLPRAHFDQALLWRIEANLTPARREIQGMQLPSWSWASVTNRIAGSSYSFEVTAPLVVWYETVPSAVGRAGRTLQRVESQGMPSWWHLWQMKEPKPTKGLNLDRATWNYCTIFFALQENLFGERPVGPFGPARWQTGLPSLNAIREQTRAQFPTYEQFYRALPNSEGTSIDNNEISPCWLREDVIMAKAQIATFAVDLGGKVFRPGRSGDIIYSGIRIFDAVGDTIGLVAAGQVPFQKKLGRSGHAYTDSTFIAFSLGVGASFGTICRVRLNRPSRTDFLDVDKNEEFTDFGAKGQSLPWPPIVFVMMLEFVEDGLARRIGLGWVYMKNWATAKRQTKLIALC